jgi:hypothetical protein
MARIPRITHKIFAADSGANGVFGSGADGTKVITTNIATLMSKAAWLTGWVTATLGSSKFPAIEEMNAVENVHSQQIAYLLQSGIPEYDAGTTYYQNNLVMNTETFELYGSIADNHTGHSLTDASKWQLLCDLTELNGFGRYNQTILPLGSAYDLSSNTPANFMSLTLSAGHWMLAGMCVLIAGSGSISDATAYLVNNGGATPTSTTNNAYWGSVNNLFFSSGSLASISAPLNPIHVVLTDTTQINMVAQATFSGSCSAHGFIKAWGMGSVTL